MLLAYRAPRFIPTRVHFVVLLALAIAVSATAVPPAGAQTTEAATYTYVFTPIVSQPTRFTYQVGGSILAMGGDEPDGDDTVLHAIAGIRIDDAVPVSAEFAWFAEVASDLAPAVTVRGDRYGCPTTHCGAPTGVLGVRDIYGSYEPAPGEPGITHVLLVVRGGLGPPNIVFNDDEWTIHEVPLEFDTTSMYDEDLTVYSYSAVVGPRAVTVAASAQSVAGGPSGSVAMAVPHCGKTSGVDVGVGQVSLSGGSSGMQTRECPYAAEDVVEGVSGGIAGLDEMFVEGNELLSDVAPAGTTWTIGPGGAVAAGVGNPGPRMVVIHLPNRDVLTSLE